MRELADLQAVEDFKAQNPEGLVIDVRSQADYEEGHMDKASVEDLGRRLGKRVGVTGVHPHRFRRTCATMALKRGMPIEPVSKMLGHEQRTTTQIYLDLNERDLEIAHEKYVL